MFIRVAHWGIPLALVLLSGGGGHAATVDAPYVAAAPTPGTGLYKTAFTPTLSYSVDPESLLDWNEAPANTATGAGKLEAPATDPEIAGIPLPPAIWLIVSGLVGISVVARQRRRR